MAEKQERRSACDNIFSELLLSDKLRHSEGHYLQMNNTTS